jgi:uncharacterized membrane protein YgcG
MDVLISMLEFAVMVLGVLTTWRALVCTGVGIAACIVIVPFFESVPVRLTVVAGLLLIAIVIGSIWQRHHERPKNRASVLVALVSVGLVVRLLNASALGVVASTSLASSIDWSHLAKNTHVIDAANVLDDAVERNISASLDVDATNGIRIWVVTVDSLDGQTVEKFAEGVGERLESTNGLRFGQRKYAAVVLLLAPTLGVARIAVGSGLSDVFSEAMASDILATQCSPYFRDNRIPLGIETCVKMIAATVKSVEPRIRHDSSGRRSLNAILISALVLVAVGLAVAWFVSRRRRSL